MWKRSIASVVAVAAAATMLGGCFAEEGPTRTELPPTDELSTEQSVPTTTTTTRNTTAARSQGLTLAAVISTAPRVDNSMYHQGAQTQDGRIEDTSQFHFVTADGKVNCSTVQRDRPTLACDPAPQPDGPPTTAARDYCNWQPDYIVLTDTPTQGTCADTPWVWVRGSVLPTGSTISVGNFQCLGDDSGLYCLNTRSGNGFALRDGDYRALSGADPAPAALTGATEETTSTSGR
jgi:hypothetical protein